MWILRQQRDYFVPLKALKERLERTGVDFKSDTGSGDSGLKAGDTQSLLATGISLEVLTFAYSLHPSIHNLNLAGFHPEALAIPALLAAYLSGHYEKWWVSSGLILLVLTSIQTLLG